MQPAQPLMASVALAFGLAAPPAPAVVSTDTTEQRAASLSISVPTSAALGGAAPGGTISAYLGTITVDDARLVLANWTATVSATNFTTGAGSSAQTVGKGRVSYWSGPVTASVGIAVRTPGQLTALLAQDLSTPRTAFSKTAGVLGTSTSWNPALVVAIPNSAVAGSYTGTVTHSVA
ncbi:hypothetical protein AB0M44_26050 [Streptosporangium subroseum]|uniref:hypothetical protein n=1 Tax=Streptosporangium subroseum TaxID=106412 RepID=UPI00343DC0BB